MKKSYIFGAILVILVLVLAVIFWPKFKPKTATPTPAVTTPVTIIVEYKKSGPFEAQTYTINQGQSVAIKVTSDVADELHFHGYDLHTDLKSGKEGEIDFVANNTGRFEFELENSKKTLGVIEVYPK